VAPRHSQLANQRSGHNGGRDRSTLICFKCGKEGHVATVFPDRQERSMTVKRDYVKDVNLCTVLEPLGTFQQFGELFQFRFDSGAECSLIKEAVSLKLSGPRINNVVILRGIGSNTVCSNL